MFFGHQLSEFEIKEILEYETIYYIGAKKELKPNPDNFDDDRGDYRIVSGDHISY
jgi:dual specificity tyrosine-phosphorylation-regulated kinase 2/3/4